MLSPSVGWLTIEEFALFAADETLTWWQSDKSTLELHIALEALQEVQLWFPGMDLYVLTGHAAQGPPLGPLNPRLHTQSVGRLLPQGLLLLSGQRLQLQSSPMTLR